MKLTKQLEDEVDNMKYKHIYNGIGKIVIHDSTGKEYILGKDKKSLILENEKILADSVVIEKMIEKVKEEKKVEETMEEDKNGVSG